jgi:hypothetical protein
MFPSCVAWMCLEACTFGKRFFLELWVWVWLWLWLLGCSGVFVLTLIVLRVIVVVVGGGVAPKPPRLVWNGVERMHQCSL